MKARLFALLITAALALLGWFSFSQRSETPESGATAPEGEQPPQQLPATLNPATALVQSSPAPDSTDGRTALPSAVAASAGEQTAPGIEARPALEIEVVRADSGEPLSGMRVQALEWSAQGGLDSERLAVMQQGGIPAVLGRFGLERTTDSDGLCSVPEPDGTLFALARGAGLEGWASRVAGATGRLRVEASALRRLPVVVSDSGGQPLAGVPVALVLDEQGRFEGRPVAVLESALTAGDPAQALLPPASAPRFAHLQPPPERWSVWVMGLLRSPLEAPWSALEAGGPSLRFSLPPVGTVILRSAPGAEPPGGPRSYELHAAGSNLRPLPLLLENGRARSACVEFGQSLEVYRASSNNGQFERSLVGRFEGPTAENPVVEYLLGAGTPGRLVGRALNPQGLPLERFWLRFSFVLAPGRSLYRALGPEGAAAGSQYELWLSGRTDSQGRFELDLDQIGLLRERIAEQIVVGIRVEAGRGQRKLQELELGTEIFRGPAVSIDLGDLYFVEIQALLSGTLVDSLGRPLRGRLRAMPCTAEEELPNPLPQGIWEIETGQDGVFELREGSSSSHIAVQFIGPNRAMPVPERLATGSADVRLVALGLGALAAELDPAAAAELDPYLSQFELQLEELPGHTSGRAPPQTLAAAPSTKGGGQLRWDRLPEGRYRARLVLGGLELPSLRFEDVRIESGGVAQLGTLQLGAALEWRELRFDPAPRLEPLAKDFMIYTGPEIRVSGPEGVGWALGTTEDGERRLLVFAERLPAVVAVEIAGVASDVALDGNLLIPWSR